VAFVSISQTCRFVNYDIKVNRKHSFPHRELLFLTRQGTEAGRSLTNLCIHPFVKLRRFTPLHLSCTKPVGGTVRNVPVYHDTEIHTLPSWALFLSSVPSFIPYFNSVLSAYFQAEDEDIQMTEEYNNHWAMQMVYSPYKHTGPCTFS